MAAGIVAAIALPVLALLAGAGSMQADAGDRETASRIARETVASLVLVPSGGGHELSFLEEGRIAISETEESLAFAAFDAAGNYLETVAEETFREGADPGGHAFHLVRLRLFGTGARSLLELELSVEQPAAAPEAVRSGEIFATRLALP